MTGHLDHGGRWITATEWPLPDAAPAAEASLSYHYDPRHPAPTIGGSLTSGEPIFTGGGFDQTESDAFFGCTAPGMPLIARRDFGMQYQASSCGSRLPVSLDTGDPECPASVLRDQIGLTESGGFWFGEADLE
jgi:hypothetical protein